MKLDSEEQRETLLELLGEVTWQVTTNTIGATQVEMDRILSPIRDAELDETVTTPRE